jgi:hypothetical protein
MKELELIKLYYYLCECNDNLLCQYCQRFSLNSTPINEKITDAELLTIYFYCRRHENRHSKSSIYDYAKRYLNSWFPNLPNYSNFNTRLNRLSDTLPVLVQEMLRSIHQTAHNDLVREVSLVDSLPIMLCSGKRKAKVAREISEKSYCATKGIYYFGLKLHTIAFKRQGQLPVPEYLLVTSGAENDLEALRDIFPKLVERAIVCDKAYNDKNLNELLGSTFDSRIYTPVKLVKGESEAERRWKKAADDLFSTAVSTIRQPIESLFNWIIEKSDIQDASKVRSSKGLMVHTFGSLATAMLFWITF